MPDMLVNLSALPSYTSAIPLGRHPVVEVRRAQIWEKDEVMTLASGFYGTWSRETEVAFHNHPVKCWIAVLRERDHDFHSCIVGFAVYDSTRKNFFGPTGVVHKYAKRGIGKELLLASLWSMYRDGYGYAIIGGVNGPQEFYQKTVGATEINLSGPTIYDGELVR